MDYTKLNAKLAKLNSLRRGSPLAKTEPSEDDSTWIEVYPFDEDVCIKLTLKVDSYGENEFITGIQFVKPVVKSVTDYVNV
jgi:hypothetical protein